MADGIDFNAGPEELAQSLLGAFFAFDGAGGIITETEAYDTDDPASHSFCGKTRRNASMFGPGGILYVYRSYGVHWCVNFVCRRAGEGAAVLIRAMEPVEGIGKMMERRGTRDLKRLMKGPGCVCRALGITGEMDGLSVSDRRITLLPAKEPKTALKGSRIGISKGTEIPRRYGIAGSAFLSRPFPKAISSTSD